MMAWIWSRLKGFTHDKTYQLQKNGQNLFSVCFSQYFNIANFSQKLSLFTWWIKASLQQQLYLVRGIVLLGCLSEGLTLLDSIS